jgi:hypothetical protein
MSLQPMWKTPPYDEALSTSVVVALVYPDGSEREGWYSGWEGWECVHPTDGPMLVDADDVEPLGWRMAG